MQGHDVDSLVLGFADLHGIPPQVVKAVIDQESVHVLNEGAYRYEPLGFDLTYFSYIQDMRKNPKFQVYAVPSIEDSLDKALPGGSLDAGDLALRLQFYVTVDSHNVPLPVLTAVPPASSQARPIELSDGPIPMENILYTGDSRHGKYNWLAVAKANGVLSTDLKDLAGSKPFTAQTVLAASYGLMQVAPVTAINYGFTSDGVLRQPTDLFDEMVSVDAGTSVLAGKTMTLPLSGSFALPSGMRKQWAEVLSFYNGARRARIISQGPDSYGLTVISISDKYFPRQ